MNIDTQRVTSELYKRDWLANSCKFAVLERKTLANISESADLQLIALDIYAMSPLIFLK